MTEPTRSPRSVALIWAQAEGGVIGADGRLPWHLPEDLALFRTLTTGSTVVMGRRTWESLPERFRPLPGRRNVVLTTDPSWSADGASRAGSVEGALEHRGDLWVVGGGRVYAAFLPHADRIVVTRVDTRVDGDTCAPALGPEWQRVSREPAAGWATSVTGLRYAVSEYRRGTTAPAAAAAPATGRARQAR
ncbi:dihydrofolate reductase [Geodermatophilus sp. TF02-6]|uniref:dihydrofolate reductase n=1 Tax=Geodermatophilus sp. TF02-6 TaxID=2250575 RepID=UPI000DE8942C|nr:dihydrofolate reductase [Geodermatophilus sp. TF02-6]RBY80661.1 dihydrofolate reductase [Geodermatophilus sp. TF02-6]